MSEIEKLYENAKVTRDKGNCITCPVDTLSCIRVYDECPLHYPPFTPAKQLELTKWLLWSKWWMNLLIIRDEKNYDEGIAKTINTLWQDLTPEEQAEIKRILED